MGYSRTSRLRPSASSELPRRRRDPRLLQPDRPHLPPERPRQVEKGAGAPHPHRPPRPRRDEAGHAQARGGEAGDPRQQEAGRRHGQRDRRAGVPGVQCTDAGGRQGDL